MRFLLLLVFLPALLLAETPVTISADPWCPFNCSPSAQKRGFMIDLANVAFKDYGLELDYSLINWARAKRLVTEGKIDAIVGMGRSDNNKNLYIYPKTSLGVSQMCFFTRADNEWQFENESSINGLRFGWIIDYKYDGSAPFLQKWLQSKIKSNDDAIVTVAGEADIYARLFKLLLADRVDFIADDLAVIQHNLATEGQLDKIKMAGCVAGSLAEVYIAFSKETANGQIYADALDAGIKRMIENGLAQDILANYGLNVENMIKVRSE